MALPPRARRPYQAPRLTRVRLEVEQTTMQVCKASGSNRSGGRCRSSPSCTNKKTGS